VRSKLHLFFSEGRDGKWRCLAREKQQAELHQESRRKEDRRCVQIQEEIEE